MNRSRFWWLLMAVLAPALQACMHQSPEDNGSAKEPVRWILVERRYGDIANSPSAGDGKVNPEAVVLTFQPLYPEDLNWDIVVSPEEHYVELLGFSPKGPATPGEIVSAMVRVGNAKPDRRYRLSARPSQSGVKILGDSEAVVKGPGIAVFRFTSGISGRAGIAVGVERVPSE